MSEADLKVEIAEETQESVIPHVNLETNIQLDSSLLPKMVELSKRLETGEPVICLNAEYYEFEKEGDEHLGVFIGFRTVTIKDENDDNKLKPHPAVAWMNNGETFLNAGVSLVNEVQGSGIPIGTPIQIKYVGKNKKTKIYKIFLLNVQESEV